MTQSPKKYQASIQNGKKLVQGVGYVTIYESRKRRYELSVQGTVLRRTVVIDGGLRDALYYKVTDSRKIKKIYFLSERWEPHGIGNKPNSYIIMEQRTASGKLTGYLKVVKRSKAKAYGLWDIAVMADDEDWIYYERGNAGK